MGKIFRNVVIGLALVLCVVGVSGCGSSVGVPSRVEQDVYLAVRLKLAVAAQLQYQWNGWGIYEALIVLDRDRAWTDVVAVEDAAHDVGFPETVCVIWPSDDAVGIIDEFNWVLGEVNSDDDPGNDVDPGEFGLSYPLTVDDMWLHFMELGELFNHTPQSWHSVIADGSH